MTRINAKISIFIVLTSAVIAMTIAVACGASTSQFETIQTFEADNKNLNATATAAAILAAGGDISQAGAVAVGEGSIAQQAQATAAAKATAQAESGEEQDASVVGSEVGSESEQAVEFEVSMPEGPAESGEVTILLADKGFPDPQVVKIIVGTIVKWENERGSPSSAASFDGEAESFDSGELRRAPFNPELCCFEYTFTTPGCHRYRSLFSGDTGQGAICVVEE